MAKADSRLLELTAMLTEVGLDWLALELLQGVRNGRPAEESSDDLHRAQLAVRLGKPLERPDNLRAFSPSVAEQLQGDEQLYWAREYILDRLTEATAMLDASVQQLNTIGTPNETSSRTAGEPVRRESVVDVQFGEDGPVVRTIDLARVRADLTTLRNALDVWARDTRL